MNHIFPNRESRTAQETAQEQRHLGGEEFGDPPVEVNGEQPREPGQSSRPSHRSSILVHSMAAGVSLT